MRISLSIRRAVFASLALGIQLTTFGEDAPAFEGHIRAEWTQGGLANVLNYTIGASHLRVEMIGGDRLNAVNIWDRDSGELTLLMPSQGQYEMKSLPPSFFRQVLYPPMLAVPNTSMKIRPGPPTATIEIRETGQKKNILGYACEQYQITLGSQTMEVWATDQLAPFQPYFHQGPMRDIRRTLDNQWGDLLRAKKLFPLLAISKSDDGVEQFHFEVKSVVPEKLADNDVNPSYPLLNPGEPTIFRVNE